MAPMKCWDPFGEMSALREGAAFLRVERPHGPFRRSFTIGAPIDQAQVKATCRDGALEITLPKSPEAKPKQVKGPVE